MLLVLPALVDRASLFLERATNDHVPMFVEDVVGEEGRLLNTMSFRVSTPTMTEWIEVLFQIS